MTVQVSPKLDAGGSLPSNYEAPFEEQGTFFPSASRPSRHVDGTVLGASAGAGPGNLADSRRSAGETSLMTLSAEKVCTRPPVVGDSLIQVVPWLVSELLQGPAQG